MALVIVGVMATLVATSVLPAMAAAASHTVGGSAGWTIPPNSTFYPAWSSSQSFAPGDTLVFNFPSSAHTVVKVPKASYDACSTQNQIGSTIATPPATVTLTSGTHYFICSISGHCSLGQKLAVTIANTSTSAPAPAASSHAPAPAPAASSHAPTPTTTTSPVSSHAPTPTTTTSPVASSPSQPATNSPSPTSSHAAPGPSGSGSGSTSASPALRTAGGAVLLVSVALASLLLL